MNQSQNIPPAPALPRENMNNSASSYGGGAGSDDLLALIKAVRLI